MLTWPTSIGRFIKFRLWGVTAMDIFSIQIYCKPISYCLYWFVQSQNVESSNSLLPDPKVGNWFGFKLPWCLHLRSPHQLEPSKQKIQNGLSHFLTWFGYNVGRVTLNSVLKLKSQVINGQVNMENNYLFSWTRWNYDLLWKPKWKILI